MRTPIHDLFDRGFVLITGNDGDHWQQLKQLAPLYDAELTCVRLQEHEHCRRYDVDAGGAALVGPDGFVAWRADTAVAEPAAQMREALSRLGMKEGRA